MQRFANNDIKFLTGVGPKRAELLASELNIRTFYDLLYYFPFRYVDRSSIYKIGNLTGTDLTYVQLKGKFINFTENGEGARKRLCALFSDGTGIIEVVWFNRVKYIKQHYLTGTEYILFGKPTLYNGRYSLAHPEIEISKPSMPLRGLQGVYNITEKLRNRSLSSRNIQQLIENLLKIIPADISETLTPEIISENNLMPLREALINIHAPASLEALAAAQQRLKFDELFYLQLNILRYAKLRSLNISGYRFNVVGDPFNNFYQNFLPFPLTGAQKRVIKEMRRDMGSGRQMNRLLQGDVGSGKTLVAFMTLLIAIGNGFQGCIMAPTEILASQHYDTISQLASGIGVTVGLLTGSTKKKDREVLHSRLQSGELQILIGTHAVIEDNVLFHNLGLVVIDEQHRFGVAQRAKLWNKSGSTPPHVLVMTATPIPRTLAMTVYGDLDVSVIDELPPGRKPVHTVLRYDTHRESVNRFIGEQIKLGRQIYIVYPLIHESETLDLKNLEEGYKYICDVFPKRRICFVHGQMKPAEKEFQMHLFATGQAEIMVATTVIEVGVNVPNASVMVIENAERFGLSQLHQLRGRVGRGADQSYCILMSHPKMSADTRKRLQIMTETNDGFEVAEADMKLRGPGDMEGTQQSGLAFDLKISNLAKDGQIVQLTREVATKIINDDPTLSKHEHRVLDLNLRQLFSRTINWSLIS